MAALSGEPWRGLAKVVVRDAATGVNRRSYTVSVVDVVPDTASGNQATWEGAPGERLALRFEFDSSGTPTFDQADLVTVEMRLPGGSVIGSAWNPLISAGPISFRTLHFDSDPLNQSTSLSAARAGTLEIYLKVEDTTGPLTWSADSRGTFTAPAAHTVDWARGYFRSHIKNSFFKVSNIALAGAEPSTWGYPDPIHVRATLTDQLYEAATFTAQVRTTGGTVRRSKALSGVGPVLDFSFTLAASEVINNNFVSETDDVRLLISSAQFGTDEKYLWSPGGAADQAGDLTDTAILRYRSMGPSGIDVSKAFDNKFLAPATDFYTGGAGDVCWDFGTFTDPAPVTVGRVRLFFGTEVNFRPTLFSIQYSDQQDFQSNNQATVYTHPGTDPGAGWFEASFTPVSAIYWRVRGLSGKKVGEIQVWPDGTGIAYPHARIDNLTVSSPGRMVIDPRITFAQLLQIDDSTFGTPPLSKNVASGSRLTTELGFLAARARNSRGEGQNALAWTAKLWDTANLGGSEAAPQKTRSSVGSTQGGEAGWSDTFLGWDNSLPGGSWTHKQVITTANAVGLELTNTRNLTLLAVDPRVLLVLGAAASLEESAGHVMAGTSLEVRLSAFNALTGKRIILDSTPAPSVSFFRYEGGQLEYLDGAGIWQGFSLAVTANFHALTYNAATDTWGRTFPTEPSWGTSDVRLKCVAYVGGSPYTEHVYRELVGAYFPHHGYK